MCVMFTTIGMHTCQCIASFVILKNKTLGTYVHRTQIKQSMDFQEMHYYVGFL